MCSKRSSLGRNLSALLGAELAADLNKPANKLVTVTANALQPGKYQPRTFIDEEHLQELANSIKQQGLLQPIVVRAIAPDHYEIIAGERRWRACQLAGISEIPIIVREADDETVMAMALVENLQREDLNAVDQAKAMARLVNEFSLTHQQVADLLSKSRAAVSNFLRLLTLLPEVMRLLENGDIDMGHARALLTLPGEKQLAAAKLIAAKHLSVRETEKLVERMKQDKQPEPASTPYAFPLVMQQQLQKIASMVESKINLKHKKNGKGTIEIQFNSEKNLAAIIDRLLGE